MKLQPLYDLQREINRLFIAGSKFTKDDPRLQKHIPILNKLGEKAPVFNKLAADIQSLLSADSQQSSGKLMDVSILLYSILYTQGETEESEVEVHEQTPNVNIEEVNTDYSYLQLKPVLEALTTSKPGRMEILKDALEQKVFNDSRTYQYLDIALGDKYSELCYYVENTIIPKVGRPMIPFLAGNFRYEDKTENARRLRLLYKFKYPQIPAMMDTILASSLPVLQAEVITIMSDDASNESLIIKLADDKNKQVREAAYKALAKMGTRTSFEKLKDVYLNNKNKTNLPLVVSALSSTKIPFFFQEIFDKVVSAFEEFIVLGKEENEKVLRDKLENLKENVEALIYDERDEVYDFFLRLLSNKAYKELISAKKAYLEQTAKNIAHVIVRAFNTFTQAKVIDFYEKNINDIPENYWKSPLWDNYINLAGDNYSKEKIFDTFGEKFKNNIIGVYQLHRIFTENVYNDEEYSHKNFLTDKIDKRWIESLFGIFGEKIKWNSDHSKALVLLNAVEPENKKVDDLLVRMTKCTKPSDHVFIFELMMERKIKDRFEIIFTTMSTYAPKTYYYIFNRLKNTGFWVQFPKEYSAKYKELYKKNPLEVYNDAAEEIDSKQ